MAGPSQELYRDDAIAIGTWQCRPSQPEFPGGWMAKPTFVFPRTCVEITQEGEESIVVDPNVAVLYRGAQEYSRRAVDPAGDRCEWFEFDPRWVSEIVDGVDPKAATDASPIKHTHAPATSEAYLLQRMLTRYVVAHPEPDQVLIEETLMRLAVSVLRAAHGTDPKRSDIKREHRVLVDDAKAYLALHYSEQISLADVGQAVGASPFHLARLFRRLTGRTIHGHLSNLRLRAALEGLEQGSSNITEVALEVGFASHSHLTKVFRDHFGMTPSRYRQPPDLTTIVIA
jgi:AraC family transcriptional regulator